MTLSNKLRVDPIRQSEAGECGLACIAMIASHFGLRIDLGSLRRRFPLSARGATVKTLLTISDSLNLSGRPLRAEIESLAALELPAILHWDLNHFVVLLRIRPSRSGPRYDIIDPASGEHSIALEEITNRFTGIAIEFEPTAAFTKADHRPRLHLSQLWSSVTGLPIALGQVLCLSIISQIALLATPFYLRLAIDSAIPAGDVDLLNFLAIAFVAVLGINTASSWIRTRLLITLNNSLTLQTASNLFRQTIGLPVSWFEKRHLGDIASRFSSLQPISDLLSRGLVAALIDGVLAITTLILMAIASPILTFLTAATILSYACLKLSLYKIMRAENTNLLATQAIESSYFIENIRGIAPIKSFGQEANRRRLWREKRADVTRAVTTLGRLTARFDALNSFMVGLETIVFVYVSARLAMNGAISIGTIFAYQLYKQQFVGAATRLVDQSISYRLLDVHLDRISDIAFAQPEPVSEAEYAGDAEGPLQIELRSVSFSYGEGLGFVLENVTLTLPPGKTVAFVGPSGAGKTTLFKILSGLLPPSGGEILINGIPIDKFGLRNYRRILGVVSQEDTLFAGTLAENISFFDPDYSRVDIQRCAETAQLHTDVALMPAGFETQVGDMGSTLSGGQKQRVLLARALYRQPRILLLDEGTAHLDVALEAKIAANISDLAISRVLVAHRPETIRTADVIYLVRDRRVVQLQMGTAGPPSREDASSRAL